MKNLMNQVYELTNLALLTPQNLVENIQLESFSEIKYYRKSNEIVCEMLTDDENEMVTYFYYFSLNNKLQRIYAVYGDECIQLFDRSKELRLLLDEYDEKKQFHIA